IFVRADGKQLNELTHMIERENIIPNIDSKIFGIKDIDKALDYAFNQHTNGKVLLKFDDMEST
ncbi:zinc-binding dehydrogenase, partial [Staphylococcus gallinarum]